MSRFAWLIAVSLLGCHKDRGQPLGDTGFVVDVPSGWRLHPESRNNYQVDTVEALPSEAPGANAELAQQSHVSIVLGHDGVASLDAAVKLAGCEDPAAAIREVTPAGAFFVQCTVDAAMVDARPVHMISVSSHLGSGATTAWCSTVTTKGFGDLEAAIDICRSLRIR